MIPFLLCLSLLCACADGKSGTDGEETTEVSIGGVTLTLFAGANSPDAALKKHKTLSVKTVWYDKDAEESVLESGTVHSDDGKSFAACYEDSDGAVAFTSGDRTYILDGADGSSAVQYYVDGQLDDYMARFKDSVFFVSPGEKLTGVETADGRTTVTTQTPVGGSTAFLDGRFDAAAYDKLVRVYVCDEKTLEAKSVSVTASDGQKDVPVCRSVYIRSDDSLDVPGFVSKLSNAKQTRKVTLHYAGDVTRYILEKEARFGLTPPDGFALYTDAAGKRPAKDVEKAGEDREFYLLEAETTLP